MGIITTAFVKQFGSTVDFLVQQKTSRLAGAVRLESGVVGEEAYFDQLASTTAVKKTVRNSDTPLIKSDHRRRRVSLFGYEWADLVDKEDKLKMIIETTSPYAQNAAMALGRAKDTEIITAFDATAYTGKTGSTSTSFLSANQIAAGATGLTVGKLRSAKELLDLSDVDPMEERYIVVSPKQMTDLLETTEVTSSDFNTVKALVQGQIDTFLGFKFIMSNLLSVDGSDDRLCYAWAKSGMLLAVQDDISSRIDPRPDKSYATQVYLNMIIGATRMEEEKVVQLACVEA